MSKRLWRAPDGARYLQDFGVWFRITTRGGVDRYDIMRGAPSSPGRDVTPSPAVAMRDLRAKSNTKADMYKAQRGGKRRAA